jgi:hypothetical protein
LPRWTSRVQIPSPAQSRPLPGGRLFACSVVFLRRSRVEGAPPAAAAFRPTHVSRGPSSFRVHVRLPLGSPISAAVRYALAAAAPWPARDGESASAKRSEYSCGALPSTRRERGDGGGTAGGGSGERRCLGDIRRRAVRRISIRHERRPWSRSRRVGRGTSRPAAPRRSLKRARPRHAAACSRRPRVLTRRSNPAWLFLGIPRVRTRAQGRRGPREARAVGTVRRGPGGGLFDGVPFPVNTTARLRASARRRHPSHDETPTARVIRAIASPKPSGRSIRIGRATDIRTSRFLMHAT